MGEGKSPKKLIKDKLIRKMESKTFFLIKKHKTMYGKLKMFDSG
jgi:hypothetical protein